MTLHMAPDAIQSRYAEAENEVVAARRLVSQIRRRPQTRSNASELRSAEAWLFGARTRRDIWFRRSTTPEADRGE